MVLSPPDGIQLSGARVAQGLGVEVSEASPVLESGAQRLEAARLYRRARDLQNRGDGISLETAKQIYAALTERYPATKWAKSAQRQLNTIEGGGSFTDQVEVRGRRVLLGMTQPEMLLASAVAPMAFHVGRVGGLASPLLGSGKMARFLGRPGMEAFAYGLGFLAETTTFSSVHYGAGRYLGKSEAQLGSFASSWAHGTWMLGGMKVMGLAGNFARRQLHGIDALGRVTRYKSLAPWTGRVLPELTGVLGGMAGIGLQNFSTLGFSQDGWGLLEGALEMHLSFKGMAGFLGAMPQSWKHLETRLHHQAALLGEGRMMAQVRRFGEAWKQTFAVPPWRSPLVLAMEGGSDGSGPKGPTDGIRDNLIFFPPSPRWKRPAPEVETPPAVGGAGEGFSGVPEGPHQDHVELGRAANVNNVIQFPARVGKSQFDGRRSKDGDLRPVIRDTLLGSDQEVVGLVLGSGVRAQDIQTLFGELPYLVELHFKDPIPFETFRNIMALEEIGRVEHLNVDQLFSRWSQARRRKAFRILANNPRLRGLRSLSLQGLNLAPHDLAILARGSQLSGVTHLNLRDNPGLGSRGLEVLAGTPTFHQLTHLVLQNTGIGDVGLRALMTRDCAPRLTHLEIQENALTLFGLWVMSRSPHAASLSFLDLSGSGFGPGVGEIFSEGSALTNLRHLNLSRVARSPEDTTDFLGSALREGDVRAWKALGRIPTPEWQLQQDFRPRRPLSPEEQAYLEILEQRRREVSSEEDDWGITPLSVSDMERLANSRPLSGLQSLVLIGNGLTPQHWGALLRGAHLRPTVLDLSDNPLAGLQSVGESLPSLFETPLGQKLEVLSLRDSYLIPGDLARLFSGDSSFLRLHTLELGENPYLGDGGLAEIPQDRLPLLSVLDLRNCGLTDAGAQTLISWPRLGELSALHVGGNRISPFLLARLNAAMPPGHLFQHYSVERI